MIFSRVRRLRLSSASTVARRERAVSARRSRSTSRATAEEASSIAVIALSRRSRSRSSIIWILSDYGRLVVPLLCKICGYGDTQADDNHRDERSTTMHLAARVVAAMHEQYRTLTFNYPLR